MQVEIIYINEIQKLKWVWVVQIYKTDEWLDAFVTFPEAENYCKENGHEIKSWG
jgi:hypothetical protein